MDSYVEVSSHATTFVGEDATLLFAAMALRGAIRLYVKTGVRASRSHTPTAMSAAATRITGKSYKRGQLGKAVIDLTTWIEAMKSAMPVEDNR